LALLYLIAFALRGTIFDVSGFDRNVCCIANDFHASSLRANSIILARAALFAASSKWVYGTWFGHERHQVYLSASELL